MTEDVVDVGAMDDFNNFTIVTATTTSPSFDQCQKWFQKFYCHQYNPWCSPEQMSPNISDLLLQ